MCRLLLVKSDSEFEIKPFLEKFSYISQNSSEYQGHGWGCVYLKNNEWIRYKNINPIWEEHSISGKTNLFIAHARSAFRDEGISIENNMPFDDGKYVFIFNGELRGVKINAEGRIGAEKIFNYIKRFDKGNIYDAIEKGTEIIKKRTAYIRAMNFMISDKENVYVYSCFNEKPEYFTLHYKKDKELVICSDKFPDDDYKWMPVKNNSLTKF